MHAWKGWAVAVGATSKTALTWDEWRIYLQRVLGVEQDQDARERAPQQEYVNAPLSERELARLSFVRWLYQTGRLDPARDDNLYCVSGLGRRVNAVAQANSTSDLAARRAPGDSASAISAVAYGFMGSQALFSALELGLFSALADAPLAFDALASRLGAPAGPLRALLSTCVALELITWDGECYHNCPASQRFLVRSSHSYVGDYYLRQIDGVLYDRMRLVRALLRGEPVDALGYADALGAPQATEDFIRGQHGGSLAPAALLARTLDLSGSTCLLDLGGGSGAFAIEAVKRYPGLSAVVYDLPQVVRVTEQIIQETGLERRIVCASGDLRDDAWPEGADLILLSYIVSCYPPATLHALLARCLAYLPGAGRLVIHDFALTADRNGPRNTALFLFGQLTVSAQTTPFTGDELSAAMRAAGFEDVTVQPFLPDLTFLLTARKPA